MNLATVHSVILIGAILASFLYAKSPLAAYDLQFSALLFAIFFLVKKWFLPKHPNSHLLESVVFTLIIVSVVMTTGGVASPLFFLIYFLLFSLSLLLEPVISITTTLALIISFLFTLAPNQTMNTLIPIFSLAFLTPFALFLGQEFAEHQKSLRRLAEKDQETYLFLSLVLKNHLQSIKTALENFMGDHELHTIKKHASEMERVIEKFEKKNS